MCRRLRETTNFHNTNIEIYNNNNQYSDYFYLLHHHVMYIAQSAVDDTVNGLLEFDHFSSVHLLYVGDFNGTVIII